MEKYCGDGRIGHGRKKRTEPQCKLGDKISNFRDTCNHKYSRAIVDFAKSQRAGKIIIEDMKGISEINLFLKDWSYYDLQNKITNKAAEYGIEVVTIDPKYTSRRCSKCGNINTGEDNLKNDRFYVCELCGYRTSYDHNAARNIAFPNIEEEIDKQLAVQEIEPPKKDGRKSREEKNINSPVANRKG